MTRPCRRTSTRSEGQSPKIACGSSPLAACQNQAQGRTLNSTNIPYTYNDKTQRYEGKGHLYGGLQPPGAGEFPEDPETEENYTFNINASMDVRSLGNRKDSAEICTRSRTAAW